MKNKREVAYVMKEEKMKNHYFYWPNNEKNIKIMENKLKW